MDFLLLGHDYFKESLEALGHRAVWVGTNPDCDISLPPRQVDIPTILSRLDFKPEALLLTDDLGRRIFPSGLEKTSLLKIWYAVDGPLNIFWQKEYAPLFDLILIDQQNSSLALEQITPDRVHWLPVGIKTDLYQGPEEKVRYDFAFVGSINERVRPKRSKIIDILSQRYTVQTAGGRQDEWVSATDAALLYRRSRMVLNENLFDGVTTRMLEAMASGSLLFTEMSQNGLNDLFEPGRDLAAFSHENMIELAEYYLNNDAERKRVAASGREKVLAAHDIMHRTENMVSLAATALLKSGAARPASALSQGGVFFRQQGKVLFLAAVRWPDHDGPALLSRARTMLNRAERLGDADGQALFYLGQISILENNRSQATAYFEKASEAGTVKADVAAGLIAAEDRDHTSAARSFLKAMNKCGLEGLAAEVHVAIDTLNTMSSKADFSADHHCALAMILESCGHGFTPGFSRMPLGKTFWNAFEHYVRGTQLDPGHLGCLIGLGNLLTEHGAYTEAYQFLARAAEIDGNSEDLKQKAIQTGKMGYCL